jgi:hypothetical protein
MAGWLMLIIGSGVFFTIVRKTPDPYFCLRLKRLRPA